MIAGSRTKTGPSNLGANTPSSSTQDVQMALAPDSTKDVGGLISPSLAKEFSLGGDGTVSNESTMAVSTASKEADSLSVLTGVAELLVAMPALIARQDPTKEPVGSELAKEEVAKVYAAACKAAPSSTQIQTQTQTQTQTQAYTSQKLALPTSYLLPPTAYFLQVRPQVHEGPRRSFLLAAPV